MGLFDSLFGGNTLYYPGCLAKFVSKDVSEKYEKILRKIGIDFIKLEDLELCCGSPVLNAGYKKDFNDLVEKNLKIFKEHSIKKIITPCPACYKTFSQDYSKTDKWNIKVEHITQTISKTIDKGKLKLKKKDIKVTFHDPCHLGRHCNIIDEPRNILKFMGMNVVEMRNNKEDSLCCGAGGGMKTNHPDVANVAAKNRIKQAEDTGADEVVTSCSLCKLHLAENSKKMKVFELSEVIELD